MKYTDRLKRIGSIAGATLGAVLLPVAILTSTNVVSFIQDIQLFDLQGYIILAGSAAMGGIIGEAAGFFGSQKLINWGLAKLPSFIASEITRSLTKEPPKKGIFKYIQKILNLITLKLSNSVEQIVINTLQRVDNQDIYRTSTSSIFSSLQTTIGNKVLTQIKNNVLPEIKNEIHAVLKAQQFLPSSVKQTLYSNVTNVIENEILPVLVQEALGISIST